MAERIRRTVAGLALIGVLTVVPDQAAANQSSPEPEAVPSLHGYRCADWPPWPGTYFALCRWVKVLPPT